MAHASLVVFTVGHSVRTALQLVRLLRSFGVRRVVDVRTLPRSRHNPQFNRAELSAFLRNRRLSYRHMGALGGLRHSHAGSPNTAWRNASFRGFADYMATPEFDAALTELIELARERPIAILCAEAVPWRCHRSLIADALLARGARVEHIMGEGTSRPHQLHPEARIDASHHLIYPGEPPGAAAAAYRFPASP